MTTKTKKVVKKIVKAAPKAASKATAKKTLKVIKQVVKSKPVSKASAAAKKPVAAKAAPVKAQTKVVVKPVTQQPAAVLTMRAPAATTPVTASRMLQQPPVKTPITTQRASMSPVQARAIANRPANDTPVDFRSGDFVVYPAHGVGTIEGIETQTIAGMTVTLYAITFEKDRMRLKIPVQKAQMSGLRKLSTGDRLTDALKTLQGKAKVKRTMWSRRAQEYEAKINSGDPVQIAEVLRDLRRPKDDTEQSYSERQIYQSALERLAREVAAVQGVAETKAVEHLENVLSEAA
jgi:CarD family transcriptional regulator